MKQALDTKTTGIIVGVLIAALVLAGFLYFKDSFTPQPTVTPKPWAPPGAWSGAQGGQAPAGQTPAGQGPAGQVQSGWGGPGGGNAPGAGGFGAGSPTAPVQGGK